MRTEQQRAGRRTGAAAAKKTYLFEHRLSFLEELLGFLPHSLVEENLGVPSVGVPPPQLPCLHVISNEITTQHNTTKQRGRRDRSGEGKTVTNLKSKNMDQAPT